MVTTTEAPLACPKCGGKPAQHATKYGVRSNCCGLWSWNGAPLVDAATHEARRVAHAAFDQLWKTGFMQRGMAYAMLAHRMGVTKEDCHMKLMNEATALRVPVIVARIRAEHRKATR